MDWNEELTIAEEMIDVETEECCDDKKRLVVNVDGALSLTAGAAVAEDAIVAKLLGISHCVKFEIDSA